VLRIDKTCAEDTAVSVFQSVSYMGQATAKLPFTQRRGSAPK
jgi:hypothetical protein